MAKAACTEDEFVDAWQRLQSPQKVADEIGVNIRNVLARRRAIESRRGIRLGMEIVYDRPTVGHEDLAVPDGPVCIFSDAHFYPGLFTPANAILLEVLAKIDPVAVIANGDIFDGASISRHPPLGWDGIPTVMQELEVVKKRMADIRDAAPKAIHKRTRGNHDARFDMRLVEKASEFAGVDGFSLAYHLPDWPEAVSIMLNGNTMVKHRWHGGIHAAYNNVLKGGISISTGHTHANEARAFSDYRGIRFGIQNGTLAAPYGPQFAYTENSPVNWQPGFSILWFDNSELLDVEAVRVIGNRAKAAGRIWRA